MQPSFLNAQAVMEKEAKEEKKKDWKGSGAERLLELGGEQAESARPTGNRTEGGKEEGARKVTRECDQQNPQRISESAHLCSLAGSSLMGGLQRRQEQR